MMKTLWNTLFAALLTITWTVVPSAPAHAISGSTLVAAGTELKAVFSTVRHSAGGSTLIARLVNAEGKAVQTFVSEPATAAQLAKTYPSAVSSQLRAEIGAPVNYNGYMNKFKSEAPKFSLSRIMKEKMFAFPKESAGFYMALGAVMTFELMFNEAHNPMARQQLDQSQTDPLGQFAFYMFMVANGVATEPLAAAMQNGKLHPKLGKFIPFFGMGVGSVASNIVHELGHSPNLWKCAKSLITGTGLDASCDAAAKSWHDRGGASGIANEWAPGLLSLVGSVIISGYAQGKMGAAAQVIRRYTLNKIGFEVSMKIGSAFTLQQIVKVAGMEFAAFMIPGVGIARVVLKSLLFIGNLVLFTYVEELIRRPIAFMYKNAVDQGPAFLKLEQKMIADLRRLKKSNWEPDAKLKPLTDDSEDFDKNLNEFKKLMAAWRQTNMANVLEAHMNWEQKITALTVTYRGAYNFYKDYVGLVREKTMGEYKDWYADGRATSILDRAFPLNGVRADGVKDPVLYMTGPDDVEEAQMDTIKKIITEEYATGKLFEKYAPIINSGVLNSQLTKEEKTILHEMLVGLLTRNKVTVGNTIEQIICQIFLRMNGTQKICKYPTLTNSSTLGMHLKVIYQALGEPKPVWTRGSGYVQAFNMIDDHRRLSENAVAMSAFPVDWRPFSSPAFYESMLASMVFGPEAVNDKLVKDDQGYQALFIPPRIDNNYYPMARLKPATSNVLPRLWDVPVILERDQQSIWPDKNDPKKMYTNTYEYLQKVGIRQNVLNQDPQSFENWWTKLVEPKFVDAWTDFEEKYQKIINDQISTVWRTRDSIWNPSTVASGVAESMKQEYNLYLMVLGEILRDKIKANYGQIPPEMLTGPRKLDRNLKKVDLWNINMFAFLRQDLNLNFSDIMKVWKIDVDGTTTLDENNLKFQESILADFGAMMNLVKQIKPVTIEVNGKKKKVTATNLPNSKYQEVSKQIVTNLQMIQEGLFKNESNVLGLQFTPFEEKIIQLSFDGLTAVSGELMNIGITANAVSWINRNEGGFIQQNCQAGGAPTATALKGISRLQAQIAGCEIGTPID